MNKVSIQESDPRNMEVVKLLSRYAEECRSAHPPHETYVLDPNSLASPDFMFWIAQIEGKVAGCIALKLLDHRQGEVKSLCVDARYRGHQIGKLLVQHLIKISTSVGLSTLLLETGNMDFFKPARKLYSKFGFLACGRFGDYADDPNSVFMRLKL